jgi:hypothetical protein
LLLQLILFVTLLYLVDVAKVVPLTVLAYFMRMTKLNASDVKMHVAVVKWTIRRV